MDKERIDQIQEQTSQILQIIVRFATEHNLGKLSSETYKDPHCKLIADLCTDITSITNESLAIDDILRLEDNFVRLEELFVNFQLISLELGYDIPI